MAMMLLLMVVMMLCNANLTEDGRLSSLQAEGLHAITFSIYASPWNSINIVSVNVAQRILFHANLIRIPKRVFKETDDCSRLPEYLLGAGVLL
ncbi:hypothetical protein P7K49_026470 [Saguinus oedipus]|uniref:Uncharacterized protein n=1 Tax=Saguinus oedipus TaxID=9490 RepID=A0ABQ9UD87_SAGOE|nr:hypothetical protein P7K49_026470 [Saguinus oedipus]